MIDEGSDKLRDDVADPATWTVRVCTEKCTTCIFRPGNLMDLTPGRLAQMIRDAIANEGHIVCHSTLGTDASAICAGYAAHPRGRAASLALRLVRAGVLTIQPVTPAAKDRPIPCSTSPLPPAPKRGRR
ncbi:hypothetical protein JHN59_05635 [Streptomyces sp. MBT49]|uniref:hypothetical protein n=1 Tax=Streptomyces sp. MBT49 TaxID=1488380 RepID=UPI00190960BC|nr:hypothetical protein [Streptomyces sp. MBT49]MBK3624329.1 hypothetical protein [Streptomyces sp. MBT49]